MECWYDTLFECDCQGITDLLNVPCAGTQWMYPGNTRPDGALSWTWMSNDAKLNKRMHWIALCAGASAWNTIEFCDWRSNDFKIFLSVYQIRVWYKRAEGWMDYVTQKVENACYFLGRLPWYWDYVNQAPYRPFEGHGPQTLPWPFTPSVPTGEYLPLNIYTKDDIILFHGQTGYDNITKQQAFIAKMKAQRDGCLAANYPSKPPTQQRTVTNQDQPMTWPGEPVNQMTPPTPDAPPTPPEAQPPTVQLARLTLAFGETDPGRPDGLQISLYL